MPDSGVEFRPLDGTPGQPYRQTRCIDRKDSPAPPVKPLKTLYTLVRADLPAGVQVAQAVHAASEASGFPPTVVVALAVPDEAALRRIALALGSQSLTYKLIEEDYGPFAGQAMAVGVVPVDSREAIRKVVSDLPLVR